MAKDDWVALIDAALEYRLGLVPRKLYDLAISGELGEVRRQGRALLVSRESVARYARARAAKGRGLDRPPVLA